MKKAKVDVFGDIAPIDVQSSAQPDAGTITANAKPAKGESEMFRTNLYLSRAVHDVLREIAFHERKKLHDLYMEGVDHVLQSRRHPSSQEIRAKSKA